jgi:hypothetical protein
MNFKLSAFFSFAAFAMSGKALIAIAPFKNPRLEICDIISPFFDNTDIITFVLK